MRRGRPNTTGFPHVQQPGGRGGYRAVVTVDGFRLDLGRWDTPEEAAWAARLAADAFERGWVYDEGDDED